MNVGLVIYDLRSGGAERVLCKWSDLLSVNHNIKIFTFDGRSVPAYHYSGSLIVLDVPSDGYNRLRSIINLFLRYIKLQKQIRENKIDLVISFFSTANFPAMFVKGKKIASIRLYREYYTYRRIYRFLIKHTKTQLVVQTVRLQNDIVNDVGEQYRAKIHVLGNPLDINRIIEMKNESVDSVLLDRIAGKKVICFTASFKKTKNHINLLRSFILVKQAIPDSILILIGGDGELEQEMKERVNNSSIKDSVIFIGKTSNPFKYERLADVFVLPSLTEGIPNVLLEAMAVGLPVISTDCPSGPQEILCKHPNYEQKTIGIKKAEYGVLIEEFDESTSYDLDNKSENNRILADAIIELLSDYDLNCHYRQMSLIRASKYDLMKYKEQLNNLLVESMMVD